MILKEIRTIKLTRPALFQNYHMITWDAIGIPRLKIGRVSFSFFFLRGDKCTISHVLVLLTEVKPGRFVSRDFVIGVKIGY